MGFILRETGHLFGHTIAEHAFSQEAQEIRDSLRSIQVPLRPAGPFTDTGRPPTPKRHRRAIGGRTKQFLLPVDQGGLNKAISEKLRALGWQPEPLTVTPGGGLPPIKLKGDFHKNTVFAEVEFGNAASLFRDLFKFQVVGKSGVGKLGVLVTAEASLAKFFDSGVATYEIAIGLLEYMSIGIQVPVWIIGLQLDGWDPVRDRYEEMREEAEANGVACHTFEDALGAVDEPIEVAEPAESYVVGPLFEP